MRISTSYIHIIDLSINPVFATDLGSNEISVINWVDLGFTLVGKNLLLHNHGNISSSAQLKMFPGYLV